MENVPSFNQIIQQSIIDQRTVSKDLSNKQSSLQDRVNDLYKVSSDQRFPADQNDVFQTAFHDFIQHLFDPLKRDLFHRCFWRVHGTVQTIIIAFPGYHKIHFREIPVVIAFMH